MGNNSSVFPFLVGVFMCLVGIFLNNNSGIAMSILGAAIMK